MLEINKIHCIDVIKGLKQLDNDCMDLIITSPPYWGLRDYGEETNQIWDGDKNHAHEFHIERIKREPSKTGIISDKAKFGQGHRDFESGFCEMCGAWYGQLGLEPTLGLYIQHLLQITAELKRVLKPTGMMFWNHGDCYGGTKGWGSDRLNATDINPPVITDNLTPKCLALQNERLILKMIDEQGWILRNRIVWHKPNAMPSSVKDRFTNTYEPVYYLCKSQRVWFDLDAVRVPHAQSTIERREYPLAKFGGGPKNPLGKLGTVKSGGEQILLPSLKPFNIRKRVEMGGKPVGFMASPLEMEKQKKSMKDRMKDTKNPKGSLAYNMKKTLSEVRLGVKPMVLKGKNPGDVWNISTQSYSEAHFATFPEKLIEPLIKAGCPRQICKKCGKIRARIRELVSGNTTGRSGAQADKWEKEGVIKGRVYPSSLRKEDIGIWKTIGWTDCGCNAGWEAGIVLDPFMGSGTVALVAKRFQRNYIGFDNNPEYIKIANKRISKVQISMFD